MPSAWILPLSMTSGTVKQMNAFAFSINPSNKPQGQVLSVNLRHIVGPSPQHTPFPFQAGTSAAGSSFAATHAEGIFVSAHSPSVLALKIAAIRKQATELGRDPKSIKFFSTFTPILGRTDEEAQAKYEELKKYASVIGELVLFSGWTGIDISRLPLDQDITAADSLEAHKVTNVPRWTPRIVAEKAAIGGLGPVGVGTPEKVADELERWVREADLDGFNIAYVSTPGTFEDVVDLSVPELRRRGIYSEALQEGVTASEKEAPYEGD
ncbi:luciferase-like domain-containing protein [Aspergillus fruticulosus]